MNNIVGCLQGVPNVKEDINEVINEIGAAIEDIKDFKVWKIPRIKKAIETAIDGVKRIIYTVESCTNTYPELVEFFNTIKAMDTSSMAATIAKNIVLHGGQLKQDFQDMQAAWTLQDWHGFGFSLGHFIHTLIVHKPIFTEVYVF